MSRYIVLRDCHYAFRYWNEGEVANFAPGVKPPEHFELMKNQDGPIKKEVVDVPAEPTTMSAMNEARKDAVPNTGMSHDPEKASGKKQKALEK